MDLSQVKLSKAEWISIEIPVNENEKKILHLINDGYNNINIKYNDHLSILSMMKLPYSAITEQYVYHKYFEKDIHTMQSSLPFVVRKKTEKNKAQLKKKELIRLEHMDKTIHEKKHYIFEFTLLSFCKKITDLYTKKDKESIVFYIYTLLQLRQASIHSNIYVNEFVDLIINSQHIETMIKETFYNSYQVIEKNENIMKYEDYVLYNHQKELFSIFKRKEINDKKMVFYTSSTGSGKTLSPIGLSIGHKIIYICAARHIGIELAKSSISMNKCVAFAFGCESANDIRLHYYSAVEFTKNKKSGAIAKVDNSNGTKVEIMICDVRSYLIAMYYMLSFNEESKLIMYWDEPTISLDQAYDPLHKIIQTNWNDNKISKIVMACATLPTETEIRDVIDGYRIKFEGAQVYTVSSFECKKTVSLLNSDGNCVLPHLLFDDYDDILRSVDHCFQNKSLLRYLDLREIIRFIKYIESIQCIPPDYDIVNYFSTVPGITMNTIKLYYLIILSKLPRTQWRDIYAAMQDDVFCRYKKTQSLNSGILFTTEDAHTLTDGPTIFIAEDVEKIGNFYIKNSHIIESIISNLTSKIETNNIIESNIIQLCRVLDDTLGKELEKEKKIIKEAYNPDVKVIMNKIEMLRKQLSMIALPRIYVPNSKEHQDQWNPEINIHSFSPTIDETIVREIMECGADNQKKILLLLGIGVFDLQNTNTMYMEIMKKLADEQKLFIIIASSNYIYGTNYQFCHGILSKDLCNMTQQKTIQALGRIGRGHLQQEYTVRFRDDVLLKKLFLPTVDNIEAVNMCQLLG